MGAGGELLKEATQIVVFVAQFFTFLNQALLLKHFVTAQLRVLSLHVFKSAPPIAKDRPQLS